MVDLLEVGFTNGDVTNWKRCFWSRLGEHLGLFDIYGEAKTTASTALSALSGFSPVASEEKHLHSPKQFPFHTANKTAFHHQQRSHGFL